VASPFFATGVGVCLIQQMAAAVATFFFFFARIIHSLKGKQQQQLNRPSFPVSKLVEYRNCILAAATAVAVAVISTTTIWLPIDLTLVHYWIFIFINRTLDDCCTKVYRHRTGR
jgi:multisubunit Na+/H+ antiporter MnhB subunit